MKIKFFEDEKIVIQDEHFNDMFFPDDSKINEKYQRGEIRIVTEQARYPLNNISGMIKSGNYRLHPEFQRRPRWDRKKQSLLIESFIMNVPIPPVFLYETEFSYYEVMDGLQRMTAILDFYEDKFSLVGLEYWKELEGRKYSNLPDKIRKGIDRRYLSSIILLNETAKSKEEADKLKQLVFERINSGGVKLEPQESRNAFYPGAFNDLATKLARNRYFCNIFNIPLSNDEPRQDEFGNDETLNGNVMFNTMKDVELVLRFFAMRHINLFEGMALKDFFDIFMKEANKFNKRVLDNYEELFNDTIKLVYDIYGDDAFRLWKYNKARKDWILYSRPAIVLYDPIMLVLSQMLDKAKALIAKKEDIVASTKKFHQDYEDKFNGRNTNRSNMIDRIEIVEDYFKRFVNA